MRQYERTNVLTICMLSLLFYIAFMGTPPYVAGENMPGGQPIAQEFKAGLGNPVGTVIKIEGNAFVMHGDKSVAYKLKAGLPLFQDDTIITSKTGRINIHLNDGSQMTLAANSKIVINKSVYDPGNKTRTSFIGMGLGKVRFWIKKIMGYKESEFKVKTKTAILGVRGTDFCVVSEPTYTKVIALKEKTLLEIQSLAVLEAKPLILSEMKKTVIKLGKLPSPIQRVSRREANIWELELPLIRITPEFQRNFQEVQRETREKGVRVASESLVAPAAAKVEISQEEQSPDQLKKLEITGKESIVIENEDNVRDSKFEKEIPDRIQAPEFPQTPDQIEKVREP